MNHQASKERKLIEEISTLKRRIRELEKSEKKRKRLEEELVFSRQQLRQLIDAGPDFFFLKDIDLRYQLVNAANAGFFGREEADILARTDMELMPEGAATNCQESDRRAIREKRTVVTSEQVGDRFYETRKFPVVDAGEIVGVAGIVRDITGHKQAEEALRESEERWQFALEGAGDGVWDWNARTNEVFFSKQWKAMLGFMEHEIGNTFDEWDQRVHPDDREYAHGEINRHLKGESPVYISEHRMKCKDGTYKWILARGKIISRTPEGEPLRVIGTHTDITEHKRAEVALRESEERQKTILSNVGAHIYLKDMEYRYTYVNSKVCSLFGLRVDEIIGKGDAAFFSSASVEEIRISDRRVIEQGETITREETIIASSDNLPRTYWVVKLPLRDSSGNIYGLCGISTDITEHKRMEDILRTSEERYRALVETTSDWIWEIDRNYVYTYASPRVEDLLGYKSEEVIGKTPFDFMPPDEAKHVVAEFHDITALCRPFSGLENINLHKDGGLVVIETSGTPLFDKEGKYSGYTGFDRDITSRKRAEEALEESKEALWSLINATRETLLLIDPDGKILMANETFAQRVGKSVKEIIGTCQYDYFPGELADHRRAQYAMVARAGKPVRFQDSRLGRLFESCAYPVFDSKGAVSKIAIFATDVTDRKQSEEERAKLEAQLLQSQKIEAIGTLAGGIAHDFNNILTALVGYGTLLQMGLGKDNPLSAYVDHILSSSEKAVQLTQSLLTFSRKQPVALKPLRLNDLIKGTEKLLRRLLTEDIAFRTGLTADDTTIMGDTTQIDQILFNLATNARDAMPKGGTLTLETRRIEMDNDFIRDHGYGRIGAFALISVSDSGVGIDEETRRHIFDPFFTTKEVGKGTGLGLSTLYGIVIQHNGYVDVLSEPGAGTTFHIYLPAVATVVEEEKPVSPEVKQGDETILVAEDNEGVRTLIRTILGKYGYTVIEAVDGEDAIIKFNAHRKMDLLIIDSVMPKKNGREVYDEICKTDPHVKTLFMSGYTKDIILDKGIEEKSFHFISKPISPNDLLRKVREVLDGA